MAACTITETALGSVKRIKFAWTSESGGTLGSTASTTTEVYDGKLIWLVTVPGGSAPTADYDVTLLDSDDVDVLAAGGVDRHTSNTERVAEANLGAVAHSQLTLALLAAGNATTGTVYVYIR